MTTLLYGVSFAEELSKGDMIVLSEDFAMYSVQVQDVKKFPATESTPEQMGVELQDGRRIYMRPGQSVIVGRLIGSTPVGTDPTDGMMSA